MRGTDGRARRDLRERLAARSAEIEAAALARVAVISDPGEIADPAYAEGLRRAVPAAIGFGIATIEAGEASELPIPVELLAQSRLAARNQIPLDTVLRRYFAGYSLLGNVLLEEVQEMGEIAGDSLGRLLQSQSARFDRLVDAIAEEYRRESGSRMLSGDELRLRHVRRMLDGELRDGSSLSYAVDGWHVGIVALGNEIEKELRVLATQLDRALLLVRPGEEVAWAWLGGRQRISTDEIVASIDSRFEFAAAAVGEPGRGIDGWRLTHRQAAAAFHLARDGAAAVVGYADVGLLATVLADDVLSESLRRLYLAPLEDAPEGGATLLETLRAFFASGRNLSATAAALGIGRRTVGHRVRAIEERLSCSLNGPTAEVEAALRMWELGQGR